MTLQQELVLKAAHVDDNDLLRLMGYQRPKLQHRQRLYAVLEDPSLGLRNSHFDFRYSSRDFVHALASALCVDAAFVDVELSAISQQIEMEESRFVPKIFVETNFKRTTQPIFALAVCEHQRYIGLDKQSLEVYYRSTMPEQVRMIGEFVKGHYQEHEGRLGIWGQIQTYLFYFDREKMLVIRPDGSVQEEREASIGQHGRAEMTVKNRPLKISTSNEDDNIV